jgi:Undecaprenyl-phosphate glucose phosphotransferase
MGVIFAAAVFGEFAPNNKLILWPLFLGFILSSLFRFFLLQIIKFLAARGFDQKSILLIGSGEALNKAMQEILSSRHLGYRLHGVLSDDDKDLFIKDFYLGDLDKFSAVVGRNSVDEVILALPAKMGNIITDLVEKCEYEGIRVRIVPDFFRIIQNRAVLDSLGDIPLLGIRTEPLSLLKNRVLKRTFDIVFSLCVLALSSPVSLIIVAAIKLTSHGPVFFKQERIGANNSRFRMYKFRTMKIQDMTESDLKWTTANDNRVTSLGRILRKTNLDELPQFWNVLMGNMSVVGPRPEREFFIKQFRNDIPNYQVRHLVKSGISGLAQVNGWRGNTSIRKRIECDIYYVENWRFLLDLKIIWLTLFGRDTYRHAY